MKLNEQMKLIDRPKKVQTSHAQFLRLYKWADAHSADITGMTVDEAIAASSEALQFAVTEHSIRQVTDELGVTLRRRTRQASVNTPEVLRSRAAKRTSLILARALLHVMDALEMRDEASARHRILLTEIASARKAPDPEGSK